MSSWVPTRRRLRLVGTQLLTYTEAGMSADLSALRNFISAPQGLIALIDAPLVPIFLVVVFLMHPWLGVVMALGMIVLFTVAWATDKFSSPLSKTAFAQAQTAQQRMEDLVRGSDALTAHGMNQRAYEYWQHMEHPSMVTASQAAMRSAHLRLLPRVCA